MKKNIIILIIALILCSFSVFATDLNDSVTGGYEFNSGGFDVLSTNNLTSSGGATISNTIYKLGNGSYTQSSLGDFQIPTTSGLFETGGPTVDFSSSFWINLTTKTVAQLFWDYDYVGGTGRGISVLWLNTNTLRFSLYGVANDFTVDYTPGQWAHIVTIRDDTNYIMYLNGVNIQNKTLATVPTYNNNGRLRVGNDSGNNYLQGSLDSLMFFDKALNYTEVQTLYNSNNGIEYPFTGAENTHPTIDSYIILPNESVLSRTDWIYYQYNVSDAENDTITYNVTINKDGVYFSSYATSEQNFSISTDGNYTIQLNATDSNNESTLSNVSWIYRDTTNPLIINPSVTPKNSTTIYNVTNTLLNATFSDDNLYGYNVTCYDILNNIIYSVQNTSLGGVTSVNYLDYNRFTGTPGQKICEFTAADSHTAQEINFETKVKRSFLGFGEDKIEINGGEIEIIYPKSNKNKIKEIGYEKQKDRISPIIGTEIDTENEYTELEYIVRYNGKIDHIQSKYLGHVVILPNNNLKQGYWHDLDNEVAATIVSSEETIYSDKKEIKYILKVPNSKYKGELKTNSIGGLNIVSENVTFDTIAGQNITIDTTEDWTGNAAIVNITYTNSSTSVNYNNINNQYFEIPCVSSTINIESTEYMNTYTYTGNCNFNPQYNLTFWQSTLIISAYSNGSTTLIPNSTIYVNDSTIYKNIESITGSETFYVNSGTYSYNATHPSHNNSITESLPVVADSNNGISIYMNYNGTLTITAYNADTLLPITSENITIDLIHSILGTSNTVYTNISDGVVNITPHAGQTNLTFYGESFYENEYLYTLPTNFPVTDTLNIYLTNKTLADNTVIFTVTNSVTSALVSGVSFVTEQKIDGSWVVVNSQTTDITGRIQLNFVANTEYRFTLTKDGFAIKTFELNPILFSAYSVKIVPNAAVENENQDANIYITFSPKEFTLNDTGTLNFSINNPLGALINYSLTTVYGDSVVTSSGTNATGGVLANAYNLNNESI